MHDEWLKGAARRWIRREKTEDQDGIRTVNIEAFEQENEADLVDALRKEPATFLSFVAGEDDQVLGHPHYYPRFGFVPGAPLGIHCEFEAPEEAFMILELVPGGLQGTVEYPVAFRAAL